jgi:hypothetical protein
MTTAKQMRDMLDPVLEHHSDLAYWQRAVVLTPTRHVLRYVLLDNTSGKTGFVPRWGACDTFVPNHLYGGIPLNYAPLLYAKGPEGWYVDSADVQRRLKVAIETEALPTLRGIGTIDDFERFLGSETFPIGHWQYLGHKQALRDAAMGRLAQSREVIEQVSLHRDKWNAHPMRFSVGPLVDDLLPLLRAQDRKAIGALLRQWEERWIKKNKLEKFWEPTPFPVELG